MAVKKNTYSKGLNLSDFTLANLQEAVLWIDSKGKIAHVNKMVCQLSGYTKEELLSMNIQQLNSTDVVSDFAAYWKRLKKEKKLVFDSRFFHSFKAE